MNCTLQLAFLMIIGPPPATGPVQSKPPVFVNGGKDAADGALWQGKRARIKDGLELVVEDATSKRTLWNTHTCPTWDTITFQEVAKPNEATRWALVLSASKYPGHAQLLDLADGKFIETREPPPPAGTAFKPRKVWEGEAGVPDKPRELLVGSKEQWAKVRAELFGSKPKPEEVPSLDEIDFAKEMLLILYEGKTGEIPFRHTPPQLYIEQDKNVLIREERRSMNTVTMLPAIVFDAGKQASPKREGKPEIIYCYNGYVRTKSADPHSFVIVVLPKRLKSVVIEQVSMTYIFDPAVWTERTRLSLDQPK